MQLNQLKQNQRSSSLHVISARILLESKPHLHDMKLNTSLANYVSDGSLTPPEDEALASEGILGMKYCALKPYTEVIKLNSR